MIEPNTFIKKYYILRIINQFIIEGLLSDY